MGSKMGSAPVYFVVTQARFNPILTLDSYAPQIQEKFRKMGFPDAQKGMSATITLSGTATSSEEGEPKTPLAQPTVYYVFGDMARRSTFVLEPAGLSFQTTDYEVFETFSSKFERGLRAVDDAVNLSYTDRIGLRYLDAVFPRSGEALSDYLRAGLLGLSEISKDPITYAFSESLTTVDSTTVRLRVVIQDGRLGFPPDLRPFTLRLAEKFEILQGRHAIMDTDGWRESRQEFNVDYLLRELDTIHAEIDKTFHASVTENALNIWRR